MKGERLGHDFARRNPIVGAILELVVGKVLMFDGHHFHGERSLLLVDIVEERHKVTTVDVAVFAVHDG